MRNFPTDPMAQHNLFIAALCEDLAAAELKDTPRAKRILEITRQVNDWSVIRDTDPETGRERVQG